jgi:hypothetical protein
MEVLSPQPADEGKGVKPPLTPEAPLLRAGQLTHLTYFYNTFSNRTIQEKYQEIH